MGKWQAIELQTLISQFVNRGSRVIPVLLPDVDRIPDDLPILQQFHWVSFANIDDSDAFYSLEWGITGVKPSSQSNASPSKLADVKTTQSPPQSKPTNGTSQKINLKNFSFEVGKAQLLKEEGFLGFGASTKVIISSSSRQANYFPENLDNGITLEMVSIPAGGFVMGASITERGSVTSERPQHQVSLPAFFMGKYQVTQAQWRQVAVFPKVKTELNPDLSNFKGDNRPVEQVSWLEALEFCRRLSNKTRKEYRLPSEAEWEYACRAGTTTAFHFGATISPELANYKGKYPYGDAPEGEYRTRTSDVGSFKLANAYGLYDMHGNVCEWCADDFHDSYEGAPTDASIWTNDIKNYESPETSKLLRGGSWDTSAWMCRSAYRDGFDARSRSSKVGFRVVCVVR